MSTRFLSSSVGQKFLMAITGVLLLLFVVAHLLGNLQIFLGQDTFNHYAHLLQSMPGALWVARIGLIVIFVTHIVSAIKLKHANMAARPISYAKNTTVQASTASLYMMETGMVVLLFVIVHLLHFTFGVLQPQYAHLIDAQGRHDVFSMVIRGFQNSAYASLYIACVLLLGLHLSHGFASFFQTLGFHHQRYTPLLKRVSLALGAIIALGYAIIPVAVMLGFISLP